MDRPIPTKDHDLLEDLLDLREWLIRRDFDPSLQRMIAAHNLLIALAVDGELPTGWKDCGTLLAPVFCSNRKEQDDFPAAFQEWLHLRGRNMLSDEKEATDDSAARRWRGWRLRARRLLRVFRPSISRPNLRRLQDPRLLTTVFAILTLVTVWGLWPQAVVISGRVISGHDQQPIEAEIVHEDLQKIDTREDGRFHFTKEYRHLTLLYWWWTGYSDRLRITNPDHLPGYLQLHPRPRFFGSTTFDAGDISLHRVIRIDSGPKKARIGLEEWQPGTPYEVPLDYPETPELLAITLFVLSPFILLFFWLALVSILRRAWLQSLPGETPPKIGELRVARNDYQFFSTPQFRRLLLELRRPRRQRSTEIEPRSTIRATILNGGSFTPVYTTRRRTPEYLFLINRASDGDHQARIGIELFRQMKENDIFVEAWVYNGDPTYLRRLDDQKTPTLRLGWLAGRYPDHRLLIFSTGQEFFDRFTGLPEPWTAELAQFENVAILTPETKMEWKGIDERLKLFHIALFAAEIDGLAALGHWLNLGIIAKPDHRENRTDYPSLIDERPMRWIERAPPSRTEIDHLIKQLEIFLNQSDIDWLSACAAYPQITWDLTLRCDFWLHGSEKWNASIAARLNRLSRLPWLRYATMPEWFRKAMLARLDRGKQQILRASIEDLLKTASHRKSDYFPLQYALRAKVPFYKKIINGLLRLGSRNAFRKRPNRDPYRDYVFLNFMYGRQPGPLSIGLPRAIREWLFREGQVELGYRTSSQLFCAGLLSLGLIFYLERQGNFDWLRSDDESTIIERTAPSPQISVRETDDGYQLRLGDDVSLDLVSLPGGTFRMGSETSSYDDEKPTHEVAIRAFNIGRTEITQAQWRAVMGRLPGVGFEGDRRPVERVSWHASVIFCERLSEMTGIRFRLPSEAEWEYAARAGTTTDWSFGDDESQLEKYAWYNSNSEGETHDVGGKLPNPFGLFDIHGNVWEWCEDTWHGNYSGAPVDGSAWSTGGTRRRVVRGGSWDLYSNYCRSANRYDFGPGSRSDNIGLRVVVGSRTQGRSAL